MVAITYIKMSYPRISPTLAASVKAGQGLIHFVGKELVYP